MGKKNKATRIESLELPYLGSDRVPHHGIWEKELPKSLEVLCIVEPPGQPLRTQILIRVPVESKKKVKHRFGVYVASSVIELPGDYVGTVFRLDRTSYVAYHVVYHGVVDD